MGRGNRKASTRLSARPLSILTIFMPPISGMHHLETTMNQADLLNLYKSNPAVAKLAGMNGSGLDRATLNRLNILANPGGPKPGGEQVFQGQQELLKTLLETSTKPTSTGSKTSDADADEEEDPKPRRPLSAYNFYFQAQRQEILQTKPVRPEGKPRRSHGKIGFAELARTIAGRWKAIDAETRAIYDDMAAKDKARYQREMEEYKLKQEEKEKLLAQEQHQQQQQPLTFIVQQPLSVADTWHAVTQQLVCPTQSQQLMNTMMPPPTSVASLMDFLTAENDPLDDFDHVTTPTFSSIEPAPIPQSTSNIDHLARQMNDECTDMFINMFRQQ